MRSNNKALNVLMRFFQVIILLLIMLKLMKVINWSWWWVLAPVWLVLAIVVVAITVYCIKYQDFKDQLEDEE
jgi:membrane protein YdbS with pleckstrin-like domain